MRMDSGRTHLGLWFVPKLTPESPRCVTRGFDGVYQRLRNELSRPAPLSSCLGRRELLNLRAIFVVKYLPIAHIVCVLKA